MTMIIRKSYTESQINDIRKRIKPVIEKYIEGYIASLKFENISSDTTKARFVKDLFEFDIESGIAYGQVFGFEPIDTYNFIRSKLPQTYVQNVILNVGLMEK